MQAVPGLNGVRRETGRIDASYLLANEHVVPPLGVANS